ncbi:MAG TPA: hypothetical protein VI197_15020 [Polyangiaceae bacterium]
MLDATDEHTGRVIAPSCLTESPQLLPPVTIQCLLGRFVSQPAVDV